MNPTLDQVQSNPGQTRLLWGAVAFLGVAVLAMGATLAHIQSRESAAILPLASKMEKAAPVLGPDPTPQLAAMPNQAPPTIVINNHMTPEKGAPAAAERSLPTVQTRVASQRSAVAPPAAQVVAAPAPLPAPAPMATVQVPPAPAPSVAATTLPPVFQPPVAQSQPRPSCFNCGTVESVTAIQRSAPTGGTGAVAGGVLGALVGNQIGKGGGRTVGTLLGAIGGGIAGNAVEKQMKKETVYQVRVRMDDGALRSIEQASAPAVGSRITLDGDELRTPQAGTSTTPSFGGPASPIPVGGERS